MNSPYPWETMTDEEMAAIIRSEGTQLTPDQVTTEFITGMRNYGERYRYHPQLLAFMVRIDMGRGVNVCACRA